MVPPPTFDLFAPSQPVDLSTVPWLLPPSDPPETLGLATSSGSIVPLAPPWSSYHFRHGPTGCPLRSVLPPLRLQWAPPSPRHCLCSPSHRPHLSTRVIWLHLHRWSPRNRPDLQNQQYCSISSPSAPVDPSAEALSVVPQLLSSSTPSWLLPSLTPPWALGLCQQTTSTTAVRGKSSSTCHHPVTSSCHHLFNTSLSTSKPPPPPKPSSALSDITA